MRTYRRQGTAPGGGYYRGTTYRYVPPETNNAHVIAYLVHERNAQRGRPAPVVPRVPVSLPPSLAGHGAALEVSSSARGDGWSHGQATRAEVAAIVELRPAREVCDTDGDEAVVEDVPSMAPDENQGADSDAEDHAELFDEFGLKEEAMSAMGKALEGLQRLFELDEQIEALRKEREELGAELAGNEDLAAMARRLGWKPGKARLAPGGPAAAPRGPAPEVDSRRSRIRERLTAEPDRKWTPTEMGEAIGDPNTSTVSNELGKLARAGKAERLERGVYRAVRGAR